MGYVSANTPKGGEALAIPYIVEELRSAKEHLSVLTDVAPVHLPPPEPAAPLHRVIRHKDLDDLFDMEPDLTGFDVDVSPYVHDADDTDIRVFRRDLSTVGEDPPQPHREELCAVSMGAARTWFKAHRRKNVQVYQRDPQWRRRDGRAGTALPGWTPFRDELWPGLILLHVLHDPANSICYRQSSRTGRTGRERIPVRVMSRESNRSHSKPSEDRRGESSPRPTPDLL